MVLLGLSAALFVAVLARQVPEANVEAEQEQQQQQEQGSEQQQDQPQTQQAQPGALFNKIQPQVKELFDVTKDTAKNFHQQARPLLRGISNDVVESVNGYVKSSPALMNSLNQIRPHLETIHGSAMDFVNQGANQIKPHLGTIQDTTMNLVNQGSSIFSGLLSRGQEGAQKAQEGFGQAANQASQPINSFVSSASEQVGKQASNAANFASQAQDAAGNVANQAKETAGKVANQAKDAASNVAKQANNVADQASNVASQAGQNVQETVDSNVNQN